MGKKKKSRAKYVSKGERANSVSHKKRKERGAYEVWAAKRRAWKSGKNVVLDCTQFGGPEVGVMAGKRKVQGGTIGWERNR